MNEPSRYAKLKAPHPLPREELDSLLKDLETELQRELTHLGERLKKQDKLFAYRQLKQVFQRILIRQYPWYVQNSINSKIN